MKIRQHFIEIFLPGIPGTQVSPVAARSHDTVSLPAGALAYRFFDRIVVTVDQIDYSSDRVDQSSLTYVGDIVTTEQVKRLPGDHSDVLASLRAHGLTEAVLTPCERVYVLRPGDRVVAR